MPHISGGPEHPAGIPAPPPELIPGLRWRRVFPGDERQIGELRRWLASLLPASPARGDVTVVASELAGNTLRHTASGQGGWFAVEIIWHGPVVRVAVADCGGPAEPRLIKDTEAEHGRGLLLVRGLAARMGFCGDRRGRLVWAEIPWDLPGPAAQRASQDPYEAAIRDGEAELGRRFASIPAWFGRSTLQWWALAGRAGLVTAPSARELLGLLHRLTGAQTEPRSSVTREVPEDPAERPAAARDGWSGIPPRRAAPRTRHPGSAGTGHPGVDDGHADAGGMPGRAWAIPDPRPATARSALELLRRDWAGRAGLAGVIDAARA